jgi:hypothetical protein
MARGRREWDMGAENEQMEQTANKRKEWVSVIKEAKDVR